MSKKIAIIGAGFSGLAVCYHLLKQENGLEVTLFDPKGIGGGASGIASGLLHPYPGEHARLSWRGKEAMEASLALIDQTEKVLDKSPVNKKGILRLALNEKQLKSFKKRAEESDDVEFWNEEKCKKYLIGGHYLPGIFIKSGATVHPTLYLEGLWKLCQNRGAILEKKKVDVSELDHFNQTILAAGSGIRSFNEKLGLDLKYNKGQILVCERPSYLKELDSSLIGKGYLALGSDEKTCYLGSTYEHEFLTEKPCFGVAADLIYKQVGQFLPSYRSFKIKDCLSAIRVANRKSYHPIVDKLDKNQWVITAMGSRGLLYHSYLGEKLAHAVIKDDATLIPNEVRVKR